jgi:hypothetical protein
MVTVYFNSSNYEVNVIYIHINAVWMAPLLHCTFCWLCRTTICRDKIQVPFTPVYVYADGMYFVIIHRMLVLCVLTFWLFLKWDWTVIELVEKTNTMHRFAPLLYFICWLLHVSAVACHLQGASGSVWVTWNIQTDVVVYLRYIRDSNQCVKHLV